MRRTGIATIVDFVDFECPFCRRFAPTLDAAIASAKVPVRLVRKMTPLKIHPHAMTAALAWCWAEAQGKGEAMAKALFAAPVDRLTPEGCEQIAVEVGCELETYRKTLADPATLERIKHDAADAKTAGSGACRRSSSALKGWAGPITIRRRWPQRSRARSEGFGELGHQLRI